MKIDLITHPAKAAKELFGVELGKQESESLHWLWCFARHHYPKFPVDNLTLWLFVQLRCLLLDDHVAGVFFQTHKLVKESFLSVYQTQPAIHEYIEIAESPNAVRIIFKNQSQILLHAPNFANHALHGMRFNTIVAQDIDGAAQHQQLMGRLTRETEYHDNPVLGNKSVFL